MKKIILIELICLFALSAHINGRTIRPDWMMEKPAATNNTYRFEIISGMGPTQEIALQNAKDNIHESYIGRLGQSVTASDKGVKKNTDVYEIPYIIACTPYYENKDNMWYAYLLCQIAVDGIVNPRFDDFRQCNSYTKYNDYVKKKNAAALAASVFVPGLGQMTKRHFGEGIGTFLGEAALIGGGVAMLQLAKPQKTIMDDISGNVDYDTFMAAKNKYNTYRYTSYGLFGAAAVLYGVNLWRAWACEYRFKDTALYPTAIPDASSLGYAMGVGVNVTF